MDENAIVVTSSVAIPATELGWSFTRAGGPGGQHVNTASTAVELRWDIATSPSLSEAQRARLLDRLPPSYLDSRGTLHIVAAEHRSQHQNREAALARFVALVRQALHVPRPRRRTAPSKASRERRLTTKKQRGETKRLRRRVEE